MKLIFKLLILAGALFVVVSVLSFYVNSLMSPPTEMRQANQWAEAVGKDIDRVRKAAGKEQLDSIFQAVTDELVVMTDEKFLTASEYDQWQARFFVAYTQSFLKYSTALFEGSQWPREELHFILANANQLLALADNTNHPVAEKHADLKKEIESAVQTCTDYDKAENVLKLKNFNGMSTARARIKTAKELLERGRVAHCIAIQSELTLYPDALGDAHYAYLSGILAELKDWDYYTLSSTTNRYTVFSAACKEYEQEARALYGQNHPLALDAMKKTAALYVSQAADAKCTLEVNNSAYDPAEKELSQEGGTLRFSVDTDHPDGYQVTGKPAWGEVENQSGSSFTFAYKANEGTSSRKGLLIVKAGKKTINISLKQLPTPPAPQVTISKIEQIHNQIEDHQKGMRIKVNYTAVRLSDTPLSVNAYFYYKDGTPLKDFNNRYYTANKHVATHVIDVPIRTNDNRTATIFMPYNELHIEKGQCDLKFDIVIFNGTRPLATSPSYGFTFTSK